MFVFPAFNSNYTERKRTFKCCRKCRTKRMKCIIESPNYDVVGCKNCRDNETICDLITSPPPTFEQLKPRLNNGKKIKIEPSPIASGPSPAPLPTSAPAAPPVPPTPASPGTSVPKHSPYVPFTGPQQPYYPYMPPQYNHPPQMIPNLQAFPPHVRQPPFLQHILPPPPPPLPNAPIHQQESVPSSVSAAPSEVMPGPTAEVESRLLTTTEMKSINWMYLRERFGFIIKLHKTKYGFSSFPTQNLKYNDEKILVHYKKAMKKNPGHIKNPIFYRFLLSIHAFTLNTPGFFEISSQDLVALIRLYFFKINSIFPILPEQDFWESYHLDLIPSPIIYALVLVMARDASAKEILTRSFKTLDPSLPAAEFNSQYHECMVELITQLELKIRQVFLILPELGDDDKLSRLVCQLLLIFNFNFNNFGNEQSSHDLTDCINYGMVLIIHLSFLHESLRKSGLVAQSEYLKNLWWILFVFDRFNAMINSRAMFIKREDFSVSHPTNPTLSRLVNTASNLENMLISLYRPMDNHGDGQRKLDEFNPEKFILDELDISGNNELLVEKLSAFTEADANEEEMNETDSKRFNEVKHYLPKNFSMTRHRERVIFFIERVVNNIIMLVFRTSKLRLQHEVGNDMLCLTFSENILKFFRFFANKQDDLEHIIHISFIPSAISVGFRVPLTYKSRVLVSLAANKSTDDDDMIRKIGVVFNGYVKEIEKLSDKWWYLSEVTESIKSFNRRVNSQVKKRKKVKSESNNMLKIGSLVGSGDVFDFDIGGIPTVSSASYYTEVIELMAEEEDDEDAVPVKTEVLANLQPHAPMATNYSRPPASVMSDGLTSTESWSSYDELGSDANKFIEMLNNDMVPDIFDLLGGPPFSADSL